MNENSLRLTLEPDNDGTCELFAAVSVNGFSGKGSAWFNLRDLEALSKEFKVYPLRPENLPTIAGGFWSKDIKGELAQPHLFIKAYPIGSTGELGVRIELATPLCESDRPESQHVVKVEIKTDYNSLESFAKQLEQLAKLQREDAVLSGCQVYPRRRRCRGETAAAQVTPRTVCARQGACRVSDVCLTVVVKQ